MSTHSFTQAIQIATAVCMDADPKIHLFGLGATYPNGLDGSATDLPARFPGRVWDTPCSEAAVTALAVGAATQGLRPIVHHGRPEFAFYAMDAILTQAAKWNYMFGGNYPCPILFRLCTGRQWGNGPQHTFVPRAMFSIPGLKVVVPSTPEAASGLLLSAMSEQNPVVYLEPRWLYKLKGSVSGMPMDLHRARVMRQGEDITVIAVGEMVLEALIAAERLRKIDVHVEVVDMVSTYGIDLETLQISCAKTGNLILADTCTPGSSAFTGEMVTELRKELIAPPEFITCPDSPCPTATSLSGGYYPCWIDVELAIRRALCIDMQIDAERPFEEVHLPPTLNVDELLGVQSADAVHIR